MDTKDFRDQEVIEHYERYLGSLHHLYRHEDMPRPSPSPLFVAEFSPSAEIDDWVYATVGMSRKSMTNCTDAARSKNDLRAELLVYSYQQYSELSDTLADLAAYPFVNHTILAPDHTIAGSRGGGIVSGSPLTDIFFTIPFFMPDPFKVIQHADGSHSHVLWIIPVHPSERLLARDEGALQLLDRFSDCEVETADFWRTPVV